VLDLFAAFELAAMYQQDLHIYLGAWFVCFHSLELLFAVIRKLYANGNPLNANTLSETNVLPPIKPLVPLYLKIICYGSHSICAAQPIFANNVQTDNLDGTKSDGHIGAAGTEESENPTTVLTSPGVRASYWIV
jgi:hypothetical protein